VSEATIADRRVHPATVALRFVKEVPSTIFGLPAAYAILDDAGVFEVIGFIAAIGLAMLLVNWLIWYRFRYGVGESEIVIESGVLSRNRRSIPFDRIQDVDTEQRLLQRIFGLAKVRIETGGSAKDEGLLDSVTLAEADRLRAAVRVGRGEGAAKAEVRDDVQDAGARTIFAMSFRRVLLAGAYNFSLFYLAALFALLQQFDDWLPFDIYDPARWIGIVEAGAGRLTPATALVLLLFALLLGVIAGILRTLAREYGFRLVAEGRRLRRTRGLFTRSEVVIPIARIQLAQVETGPIRRAGKWFTLSFQTLGGSADRGSGGRQAVAPLARVGEMQTILAEEGRLRLPERGRLARVSQRHILRLSATSVLLPVAFIGAGAVLDPRVLLLLAFVPALAGASILQWLFHRYALDGDLLFVSTGFWRHSLWVVPVRKTQGIGLSRSPLQRLLGLATLSIDTAGAPAMGGPRIVDIRLARGRALYEELSGLLRQP
jgi:putative membrane protein